MEPNFVSFWHNWLLLSKIIWRLTIWVNHFFRKIPTLSKLFKSKCYTSEILKTLDGRWALGVVIRWLRNFYQTTYTADGQKILTTAQLGVHTKTYTMDFFMTRSIYYHLLPSMKKALSSKVYKKISLHFWWEGNSFYDRYLIIHRCICQSNWVFLLIIDANDSMLLGMDFRTTLHTPPRPDSPVYSAPWLENLRRPVKSTLFFSGRQKHLRFSGVATWEKAGFHKVNQKKMGAMP